MSLTRQDVEKIARLARLSITDAEMPVYVTSLSSIVDFVDEQDDPSMQWVLPVRERLGPAVIGRIKNRHRIAAPKDSQHG